MPDYRLYQVIGGGLRRNDVLAFVDLTHSLAGSSNHLHYFSRRGDGRTMNRIIQSRAIADNSAAWVRWRGRRRFIVWCFWQMHVMSNRFDSESVMCSLDRNRSVYEFSAQFTIDPVSMLFHKCREIFMLQSKYSRNCRNNYGLSFRHFLIYHLLCNQSD